jgi:hypothetical protein
MFRGIVGVAAITGKVSGFLEVIDFEAGAPFNEWSSLIDSQATGLRKSLVIIGTPSGAYHVLSAGHVHSEGIHRPFLCHVNLVYSFLNVSQASLLY